MLEISEYGGSSDCGTEQGSKDEWVPRTVSVWESVGREKNTRAFPRIEQREGKYKAEGHLKNKETGQGSMTPAQVGFCKGRL